MPMSTSRMSTSSSCLACFARQAGEATRLTMVDAAARDQALADLRRFLDGVDPGQLPVVTGQTMHRRVRELSGSTDPYRSVKRRFTELALAVLPELERLVRQAPDPLSTALRLAVAANVIDSASGEPSRDEVLATLRAAAAMPLHADVEAFRTAASQATSILYLTDNAGEIVLDRLLIEQLGPSRVTVAVRGGPILNDATRDDARAAGLAGLVEIVDNGSDAPGTVLDDCSPAFRTRFAAADLVIAKGQGNYESLCDAPRRVFLLFKVKCQVVADQTGLSLGTHALLSTR